MREIKTYRLHLNSSSTKKPILLLAHLQGVFPASTLGFDEIVVDAIDGQEDKVGNPSGSPGTSQ